jgi:hypothetical protein
VKFQIEGWDQKDIKGGYGNAQSFTQVYPLIAIMSYDNERAYNEIQAVQAPTEQHKANWTHEFIVSWASAS